MVAGLAGATLEGSAGSALAGAEGGTEPLGEVISSSSSQLKSSWTVSVATRQEV